MPHLGQISLLQWLFLKSIKLYSSIDLPPALQADFMGWSPARRVERRRPALRWANGFFWASHGANHLETIYVTHKKIHFWWTYLERKTCITSLPIAKWFACCASWWNIGSSKSSPVPRAFGLRRKSIRKHRVPANPSSAAGDKWSQVARLWSCPTNWSKHQE